MTILLIGDTVNLASRLEGLNKIYGTKIIISSSTYERLITALSGEVTVGGTQGGTNVPPCETPEVTVSSTVTLAPDSHQRRLHFRELDLIRVKGKQQPVTIYEVLEDGPYLMDMIRNFQKALYLYRERRFKEAGDIFNELYDRFNDPASKVFLERCRIYLLDPPPEGWDGVYVAKEK